MPATCKCDNGHEFTCGVLSYDPDINSIDLDVEVCPECGAEFEIHELFDDSED